MLIDTDEFGALADMLSAQKIKDCCPGRAD